jgi:hypothetical protein
MDEHLQSVIEEFRASLKKLRNDHRLLTNTIAKLYSEENKGQLIIASGSFVLLVNYIGSKTQLNYKPLLISGVVLLVLNILLKFHLIRLGADRTAAEIQSVNKRLKLTGSLYSTFIVLPFTDANSKKDSLTRDNELLAIAEKEFEDLPKFWGYTKYYNGFEYILFFVGLSCILMFFVLNLY